MDPHPVGTLYPDLDLDLQFEILGLDPDPHETDADPKHCLQECCLKD
jgi:hypothetical protein